MIKPRGGVTHSESHAVGRCDRCDAPYGEDDRRRTPQGGALCRSCHRDPGLRLLPVSMPAAAGLGVGEGAVGGLLERGRDWLGRCLQTLKAILFRPAMCFRAVQEPVALTPLLAFLWTLAAPWWIASLIHAAWQAWHAKGPRIALSDPRWADYVLGAAGVDALDLWVLAVAPLLATALYFCVGTVSHLLVLMTGPTSRTLGASLRAVAIASVPLLLLSYTALFLFRVSVLPQNALFAVLAGAGLWSALLLVWGMSRSHNTSLFRASVAAPLPWALMHTVIAARLVFALPPL